MISIEEYLENSIFFDNKLLASEFSNITDTRLIKELLKYREYVKENFVIDNNNLKKSKQITAMFQERNFGNREMSLLKQCALYVDTIYLDDPLFRLTCQYVSDYDPWAQILDFKTDNFDKKELVRNLKYIKRMQTALRLGVVKFVPMSFYHEPPTKIPILSSKNNFRDLLSEDKLKWLRSKMNVLKVKRVPGIENAMQYCSELKSCRDILIKFNDYNGPAMGYRLFDKIEVNDNKQRTIEFASREDLPNEELFLNWVEQSMNESAIQLNKELEIDFALTNLLQSNYITDSQLVADYINTFINSKVKIDNNILGLALKIKLPITNSISFDDLIKLRQDYGEEFLNFRRELEKQLRMLRMINDPDELKRKLEDVEYDLEEVQVNNIRNSIKTIGKKLLMDLFWTSTTIAASCCSAQNIVAIPSIIYGLKKFTDAYNSYEITVKNAPSFFLWKGENTKFK